MRLTEYGRNPQKRKAYMQQSEGPYLSGLEQLSAVLFHKKFACCAGAVRRCRAVFCQDSRPQLPTLLTKHTCGQSPRGL
jgi:hypothetical protein